LEKYLDASRGRLRDFGAKIAEIRDFFGNAGERIFRTAAIGRFEPHPFSTQRFDVELAKAEEEAKAAFAKVGRSFIFRGGALAEQFEQVVAHRVQHMFAIAERESGTWMRGLLVAIEKPIVESRTRMQQRSVRVRKVQSVELDLAEKIATLQASLDAIKHKHDALLTLRESVDRFSGKRHDDEN
jgi:hypothetical protein